MTKKKNVSGAFGSNIYEKAIWIKRITSDD